MSNYQLTATHVSPNSNVRSKHKNAATEQCVRWNLHQCRRQCTKRQTSAADRRHRSLGNSGYSACYRSCLSSAWRHTFPARGSHCWRMCTSGVVPQYRPSWCLCVMVCKHSTHWWCACKIVFWKVKAIKFWVISYKKLFHSWTFSWLLLLFAIFIETHP